MDKKQPQSAYQYICQASIDYPGTPYSFQDVHEAGKRTVPFALFGAKLSYQDQSKNAKTILDELMLCVPRQILSDRLKNLLYDPPVFTYVSAFILRIRTLLDFGAFQKEQLYQYGLMLAKDRLLSEEVKLGIYILGLFQNDMTTSILRTLGLHSEFTLPALTAMHNWPESNDIVFDFAKNTTGYGRLASVFRMLPISREQQDWLFFEALRTPVARVRIAQYVMNLPDMEDYLEALFIDETSYPAISRLFAYAFLEKNAKDFCVSKSLITKYIRKTRAYAKSFVDQAALVMIYRSMAPYWEQVGVDVVGQNGWSSDCENHILEQCRKNRRSLAYRRTLLLNEMESPREDNSIIIKVLETYAFDYSFRFPEFSAFSQMLADDPFDMDVAQFLLIDHPNLYAGEIAGRILAVIPEEVLQKPTIINHDDLTPEYRPDVWLIYLLRARKKVEFACENICLRCLEARFQDVRIQAIATLRLLRPSWSDAVQAALENAAESEPDSNIAKRIKRLLGIKTDTKKEQKYVDVTEETVVRSPFDKILLETEIAGTFFRDLDVVSGMLDAGDTLLLKREPDNSYDGNAILVTTEDGYVLGYVPRTQNTPLAQLMDAGERLYALLRVDPAQYGGKPPVTIMLSRHPALPDNIIAFPCKKKMTFNSFT